MRNLNTSKLPSDLCMRSFSSLTLGLKGIMVTSVERTQKSMKEVCDLKLIYMALVERTTIVYERYM